MTTLLARMACALGVHAWEYRPSPDRETQRVCATCPAHEYRVGNRWQTAPAA